MNGLLARSISAEFDVDDTIEIKEGLSYEQLKNSAFEKNADILQSEKNKSISSYDISLAKADYLPRVSLSTGYNYQNSMADAGLVKSNKSYGYNYGLSLSLNLFNGFNTRLQYENAVITFDKNEIKLQQTKTTLEANILVAYKQYIKNLEIMKLEEENVATAKENLDLALEQLKLGALSPLEFRDVQKNYITAQNRLSSSQYTAKMSEKDLLKLSGLLIHE